MKTLLKRNVGHVKRFIGQSPQACQPLQLGIQPVAQPRPVTEPAIEPSSQPAVPRVPEQTSEPQRSTRKRTEPSWLKDYVT